LITIITNLISLNKGIKQRMNTKRLFIFILILYLFTTACFIHNTAAQSDNSGKEIERIEKTEYGRIIYYKNGTGKIEVTVRENVNFKAQPNIEMQTSTIYVTNPLWDLINRAIQFILSILPGVITALFAHAIKKLWEILRNIYWWLKRRKRPSFYEFLQLLRREIIILLL